MRTFGLVALCSAGILSAASAAPPRSPARATRKLAPAALAPDDVAAFARAVIADKAGDLERAVSHYQDANRPTAHAEIAYNIADLYRRMDDLDRAIASYKQYLELAPTAPDRAAVAKLIAQLERTPGTIVIDGDDLDAVVFVDGKPVGPSPQRLQLPERVHVIERIGPASYGTRDVTPRPHRHEHVSLRAYQETRGNVVFSTTARGMTGSWKDRGHEFRLPGRFTLPPGRHDTFLFEPGRACTPIVFDVPPGDDVVVHVFIAQPEKRPPHGECMPIAVQANKVQFAAGAK